MAFIQDNPGQPVPEKNIYSFPIFIIQYTESVCSIYYDPQQPPCVAVGYDSVFPQPHSRSPLVYL